MSKDQEDLLANQLAKSSGMSAMFGAVAANHPQTGFAAGRGAYLGVKLTSKFLPTETHSEKLVLNMSPERALKYAYSVMVKAGSIQNDDEKPPYPFLKAIVGSGAFNMNPAVVYLEIMEGDAGHCEVTITAAAKEGLIKQHTAEKACKRISTGLQAVTSGG